MRSKLITLTTLLLLVLFVSGCRDRHNVDEMAIVIAVGVDRAEGTDPILVTVQVVNSTAAKGPGAEGGGQTKPFITLTSQGRTFGDATRNLAKTSSRNLLFSHNKVVVLGKNFAESDISEVMDYIERNREFRRTNHIVVAEQTAKEVLETKLDIDKLPALGLRTMLTAKDQTFVYPININDFLLYLKTDIGVSYAPLLYLKDMNQESNARLEQAMGKPIKSPEGNGAAQMQLHKVAIFKNMRLAGVLNEDESKGLLWLINKLRGDTVVISNESAESENVVDIFEGNSTVIPVITDKDIRIKIVCTGKATLRESRNLSPQLKDLAKYKQLELETEKILAARVEQTIARAQKDLNADFLGFGNQIHNYNPYEWRLIKAEWDRLFPNIPYTVTFQITLTKAGITKGSSSQKNNGE